MKRLPLPTRAVKPLPFEPSKLPRAALEAWNG